MIDSTFFNFNGLLVLSFKLGGNIATKNSFNRYYMPLVEIKESIKNLRYDLTKCRDMMNIQQETY